MNSCAVSMHWTDGQEACKLGWLYFRYDQSYTDFMKTAISIPDSTYDAAEQMARRMGVSRSEFYTRAVASYLEVHRQRNVTKALDAIYGDTHSGIDDELAVMQRRSIPP